MYKKITKCICGTKFKNKKNLSINFKNLPITEIFLKKFVNSKKYSFNQQVNFCQNCEHMFLGKQISSKYLYNKKNYFFSSSKSLSGVFANDVFFGFLKKNLTKKKYNQILEIGSNDLYLLKKLYKISNKLIGIDPLINVEKKLKKIKTIKDFFGKKDVKKLIKSENDIIICSHTLEHIENVSDFISNVLSISSKNTKIFFQFPSAESLISSCSFDQIHHQHLNYFSLKSFARILQKLGGKIIDYKYNNLHYGSLMVYFTVKDSTIKPKIKINTQQQLINTNIRKSYQNFKSHLESYKKIIYSYLDKKKSFYVIGAGLMLPLLNYHMDNIINESDGILDDDKRKIGKYFPGINKKILSLKETDLKNSICLISPIASAITSRKLVKLLDKKKAEVILLPSITF